MQVHHWQLPGGSLLVFFTPFDNGQKTIQQLPPYGEVMF
jgi:hypothetical protein